MSFVKVFVVLCLSFVSVSALATPHAVRHNAHHRAIAARVAVPEPLGVPVLPLQRRQNSRRCKQRSSSANAPASTRASSSSVVQHTPVPTTPTKATTQAPPPPPQTTTKAAAPVIKKTTTTPAPVAATNTPKPSPPPPAPTTKQAAPPAGNLPSFMVGTQTGQGTFYSTGLGACGITNNDNQHIAAVSHLLFDNYPGYNGVNPNNNPMCGKTVTATYKGKSVVVALTDRCEGCALTDLDFSPSAFNQLADFSIGRLSGVTWVWN